MKATYIPIKEPKITQEIANNPNKRQSLEPEVLAACLARYSRSKEGIETILEKYGAKSPAAIFKFIDYGHASIGGLTGGIAIAIDDISMLAALKLFEFSQMADGQESSTRYIELDPSGEGTLNPTEIGISNEVLAQSLKDCIDKGFKIYRRCLELLEKEVINNPSIARIPPNTPEKTAQRMLKNYGLDRCRYFLPMCAKTNLALVMSARAWASTIKELESLVWKETQELAGLIRQELSLAAPELIRHSYADQASKAQYQNKLKKTQKICCKVIETDRNKLRESTHCECKTNLSNLELPTWETGIDFKEELKRGFEGKTNRYSTCGDAIKRIYSHCTWSAMALAEIRDLNRHRTGFRCYHSIPTGFFVPKEIMNLAQNNAEVQIMLEEFLVSYSKMLQETIADKDTYQIKDYFYFLGTQVPFEHGQQLDKFIYEAELRTGLGAHFKYAEHLKAAADEIISQLPELKSFIQIGTAEPE